MSKLNESESNEKIHRALELLRQASKEKQIELVHMMHGIYEDVKGAQEKAVEKAKTVAKQVDNSAHKNPWAYIGGAALVGLIVGFFVRLRRGSGNRE